MAPVIVVTINMKVSHMHVFQVEVICKCKIFRR